MATYKTISVGEETFKEFERMAASYGLTNKGLVEAILTYFKVSKADPRSPQVDNPTDAIKALTRSIKDESSSIKAFIKEQEKRHLIPMKETLLTAGSVQGIAIEIKEILSRIEDEKNGMTRRPDLRLVHRNIKLIANALNVDLE